MKLFLEGLPILTEAAGQFKVFGIAIHPGTTRHPNEFFDERMYLKEELQKDVKSLIGKQVYIDHHYPINGSRIIEARWDEKENGIYYEALIPKEYAMKIRNGQIKKVSINVNPWRKGGGVKFVNGFAPFGFEFEELSLLENMEPGDPTAWVKLMEAMQSEEMTIKILRPNLSDFKEDTFRKVIVNPDLGVEELHAIPKTGDSYVPVALFFYKLKGWTNEKIETWLHDNPQYAPQTQAQVPTILEAKKQPVERTPLQKWRKDHVK